MRMILTVLAIALCSAGASAQGNPFKGKNVVMFISDQERTVMHFPPGWEEENLPGMTRLKKNGLWFKKAFTNACMCSPARSTLMSGFLPAQHGVRYTLEQEMPNTTYPQVELPTPDIIPNLATVAAAAGFKQVVYKGKSHLNKPSSPDYVWQPSDLGKYGFSRWNCPDAGANQSLSEAGGSYANNDYRFMYSEGNVEDCEEGALQYIASEAAQNQPFFLVISLVNPHDVLFYPSTISSTNYSSSYLDGPIGLPSTVNESLFTKPQAQANFKRIFDLGGAIDTPEQQLAYINFYANLMKETDSYLVDTIEALEKAGLYENTVIIRTSDHGEMGTAHGAQRQKMFNMYEESLRIPLIFSNPQIFPEPVETDSLVGHVDFVPTIASLFDVPATERAAWEGIDYSSIILNPKTAKPVQEYIPFTYDDFQAGQDRGPYVKEPCHLIVVREVRYKIAKYYDPSREETKVRSQWEMYDLLKDPNEVKNLAAPNYKRTLAQEIEFARLRKKIKEVESVRMAPRPIPREIQLIADVKTTNVIVNRITDQGGMSGLPIGTGNVSLTYTIDFKKSSATIRVRIVSDIGLIRANATATFVTDPAANYIAFTGTMDFTSGTGAFRNIKAKGLAFADSNTLNGQNGKVSINGTAIY
ncbi:hypothetical protein Ndes2437B_g06078 [Nannochloris sp. 'desiccata']|nr:hypothetical protein KSW81_008024 [Chlorella desiccata (nom. nud.)]